MFGYVRPLTKLLTAEESERYKAAYCGLCHVIGQDYGHLPQLFLNYDFAFLAMLLAEHRHEPSLPVCRCAVFPWRKQATWQEDAGLHLAAAESVVLCYWKLQDSRQDEGFWKRLGAGCLAWLMTPAYRKAKQRCEAFTDVVQTCLSELRDLEQNAVASLDQPADAFARILQASALETDPRGQEAKAQLLYHLGRWIYLVDARDDAKDDAKTGNYNPTLLVQSDDPERADERLSDTMALSLSMAQHAYTWIDEGIWASILTHILHLGLPAIQEAVFQGTWQAKGGSVSTACARCATPCHRA